jgi:hypothetical protein
MSRAINGELLPWNTMIVRGQKVGDGCICHPMEDRSYACWLTEPGELKMRHTNK